MRKFAAVLLSLILVVALLSPFPARADGQIHWAQTYADQLQTRYAVNQVLGEYNLDDYISADAMESLMKCTMNSALELKHGSREEIVSKMVDLFSDRTGINLDQVFFIALVPFEDFAQINPDYTRNIMFAYSKGLLKGRGDNLMHPKDDLTYAEALVLTSRLESMIAAEAFYVDAELVKQEENIKFDFKLVNRSGESQDLTFASGQIYEVVVTDRLGQEVYRYSDDIDVYPGHRCQNLGSRGIPERTGGMGYEG
ncbi:MAG: BsuPI-related putative proteinase inhibitor [Syntrophomonadaceae bacterium]